MDHEPGAAEQDDAGEPSPLQEGPRRRGYYQRGKQYAAQCLSPVTQRLWAVADGFNRHGSAVEAFCAIVIVCLTFMLWKTSDMQWQAMRDELDLMREEMRPYLVLGDPEGRIARYRPPGEGEPTGRLDVLVTNHGKRVADRVTVQARAANVRGMSTAPPERHQYWYRVWKDGRVIRTGGWLGSALGPGAVLAAEVENVLTHDEWRATGEPTGPALRITGTIEYCDGRRWYCDRFTIYRIRGTDDFEPLSEPFRPCSDEKVGAPELAPGETIEWLSPCALRDATENAYP